MRSRLAFAAALIAMLVRDRHQRSPRLLVRHVCLALDTLLRQSLLRSVYLLLGVGSVTLSAGSHEWSSVVAVGAEHVDGCAEGASDRTSSVHRALGRLGAVCPDDDRFSSLHLISFPGPRHPGRSKRVPIRGLIPAATLPSRNRHVETSWSPGATVALVTFSERRAVRLGAGK